ncbi:MAG: hypothetical protein AUG49_22520 [Catenulispora sp. 13_1_20CM_3_70_7]|nr:MAG: hypothetical protein AUG49_22520 [Catenulispora sp. 13_1_20CM_3_70_7]
MVGPGSSTPGADGRYHAYFAEGYTGHNFEEFISILSPSSSQTVNVTFLFADGRTMLEPIGIAANIKAVLLVNEQVGDGEAVAASLDAPDPFVAERPMYFNFAGTITGGHDAFGAQSLADTFYFAEGTTIGGFSEYLTVMNPNPAPITIDITYYFSDGGTPSTITRTINRSRLRSAPRRMAASCSLPSGPCISMPWA